MTHRAGAARTDPEAISEIDLGVLRDSINDVLTENCERRTVHAFVDGGNDLAARLWTMSTDLGWLGIGLPERFGGLALGADGLSVLYRALGAALAPGPYLATLVGAQWLAQCGVSEFAERYLPAVVAGQLQIAIPCTPQSTSAIWHGGLSVSCSDVLMLGSPHAALVVLPVSDAMGRAGMALIDTNAAGLTLEAQSGWDRTRELSLLNGGPFEAETVFPDLDGGLRAALCSEFGLAVASDSLGAARSLAEQTIAYMKDRIQFDRPIGAFQVMKHRAADFMILLESQDCLLEQALDTERWQAVDRHLWSSVTKAGATDAFSFMADDSVLLHGGIGFTWEYDCHLFLKRAHLNAALAGDNAGHLNVAADGLQQATRQGRSTMDLTA